MNTPALEVIAARKQAGLGSAVAAMGRGLATAGAATGRGLAAAGAATGRGLAAAGRGIVAANNAPPAEAAHLAKYKAMLAPKP